MFAPNPRSRPAHSYPSPAMSYRPDEYYLHNVPNISNATPRTFAHDDHQRTHNFYPDQYYPPRSKSYPDNRDPLPPPLPYNQSYDRHHNSPPNIHLSAAPYRQSHPGHHHHHYVDRPSSSLPPLKRPDLSNMVDNFGLPPSHNAYAGSSSIDSESIGSAPTAPSNRSHMDTEFWQEASPTPPPDEFQGHDADSQPPSEPSKQKKSRREKPKIALAADQPPTTQGKPRARVYVACIQCRTRKIRCDGAKPVCHNCGRRASGSGECVYDPIPKRRGPDKTPGARQRMARADGEGSTRRRRRRGTSATDITSASASSSGSTPSARDISSLQPITLAPPPGSGEHSSPYPSPSELSYPPNNNNNNYVRSYSGSPQGCGCHGMGQCPDLLEGVSALSEYRKPTGAIPALPCHDAYDLLSITPPHTSTTFTRAHISELDEQGNNGSQNSEPHVIDIDSQPSLNFTRQVWWDSLLSLYHTTEHRSSFHHQPLSSAVRDSLTHRVAQDLRWIFKASNYWFSFFHIPTFFTNFCDPIRRESMQPSLILSLLAISSFFQSSEVGFGLPGRERALRFRDEAQGALEASFSSGWIDETLAQAAWLLALFEICAHQRHSSARSTSSMIMLDNIIRSLSLTMVDAADPATTLFPPGTVPRVNAPRPSQQVLEQPPTWFPDQPLPSDLTDLRLSHPGAATPPPGCSCASMTLEGHWPLAKHHAPMWGSTAAWNEGWSEAEIRKESCRRLCWSSMIMAAGHVSYTIAHRSQRLDLFIGDPANYAILFSGESVARFPVMTTGYSSKDTIWALHDRAFLLWHGCVRMRNDGRASDMDKAQFAVKAWLEGDALEDALNRHTCHIERAFIFQAREYIFNTRMCISYEFRRFIPLVTSDLNGMFHRSKAEEWLNHQAAVAERFMLGLHTITGNLANLLAHRPFFVFWFMGQIGRALSLWQCDNSLTVALDVCKALLPAIDYLTALWPCPEQRHRYEVLRGQIEQACTTACVGSLPPLDLTLPPSSSPDTLV